MQSNARPGPGHRRGRTPEPGLPALRPPRGPALPGGVVTNQDLEKSLDTTDAWIVERTGIRERRLGGTTASLAIAAGRAALARASIEPASIDVMILELNVGAASVDFHFPFRKFRE